ncbi:hypothetical protein MBAV_002475 [Candidatus Magnetobacterium bavaricum]|uniref:Uncharacterized protein n=1 Tax=Candidatus Magnetobacterium bavaricum TaxID=29290 RepID=A0A0F3GXC9_9BACT|nr:hypothetical protein MBAV_005823 [Candidatus Magnetobacterium bavaricum]KJU85333.1 hypothetical protein MBAV_002475 [Candidatus Magnetobacterium bavaricum]
MGVSAVPLTWNLNAGTLRINLVEVDPCGDCKGICPEGKAILIGEADITIRPVKVIGAISASGPVSCQRGPMHNTVIAIAAVIIGITVNVDTRQSVPQCQVLALVLV